MEKIYTAIGQLVDYGIRTGLTEPEDQIYATNLLLDVLKLEDYQPVPVTPADALEPVLKILLDYAAEQGILGDDTVTNRDLFDTRLMNCLMPRPSQVIRQFWELYKHSPEEATNYYFKLSQDSDYIRRYRVCKDLKWVTSTEYGDIDITINLSKPEKDAKDIAAALKAKQSSYPKCALCKENEGFAGRSNHPARENHRMIPLEIYGENWYFQYSPYVYYNEHCILLNGEHIPMKVDRTTFGKLLDFVTQFPHYFMGSNAGLPIVGGSILTHEHYQGGRYSFAMEKAQPERRLALTGFGDVTASVVKWPMSVIRLRHKDKDRLLEAADHVLGCWKRYSDPAQNIFAETDGVSHNTVTPIARRRGQDYELDLVLRNNLTSEQYPLGVFHAHPEHHHIKKENIGLIEVMGLAVLPSRLKTELTELKKAILENRDIAGDELLAKHADWAKEIRSKYESLTEENLDEILQKEVGLVFVKVLEQCGVFKRTPEGQESFCRFTGTL